MTERMRKGNPLESPLFRSLVSLTRASGFLKQSELAFFRSISSTFDSALPRIQGQLVDLLNAALNTSLASSNGPQLSFESLPDLLENHPGLISDAIDGLFEKTDVQLDLLHGKRKSSFHKNIGLAFASAGGTLGGPVQTVGAVVEPRSREKSSWHILRPQLQFHDKPDNSNRPFTPMIRYKPHAKRPLDYGLPGSNEISEDMGDHLRSIGITKTSSSVMSLPHPYEYEIQTLEYPSFMFEARPEILYDTMERTPFTYVDTEEKLDELASLLTSVQEIAVDLEHHDFRSFQGFTCLMQISTRKEDYIVDTLILRHRLHILNESFADPKIVKVFHGADSDIQWLQKDFGLYIVNLFDTYHASHVLELHGHGLAFLLKSYCNVNTDKRYQRADWRKRPLTPEMMFYARSDTHYLLYIYDRMRNELLSRGDPSTHNLLNVTLSRSAETALKVYIKDVYDAEGGTGGTGWINTLRKFSRPMNVQQFAVYRALHAWRDATAREADESIHYVLPNHMLFNLAEVMPNNAQQALACCSPVPNFVRLYANEIVTLIDHARMEALRNEKVNQDGLSKFREAMEAKNKEWKTRLKEGPLHVRFDDAEDVEPVPSPKKVKTADVGDVSTAPDATFISALSFTACQKTISGKERPQNRVLVESRTVSSLLGPKWTKVTRPSKWNEAQAIRNEMTLEVPDVQVILSTLETVANTEVPEELEDRHGNVVPMDTEETAEDDDENTEAVANSDPEPTLQSKTIILEDEAVEVVANVREKKKKKKSKKSKGLVASLKSPATATVEPPFDFKNAKSSVAQFLESVNEERTWKE